MQEYMLTPAGQAALQLFAATPLIVLVIGSVVLLILTVLMPYYIYRSAVDLRKLRHIAERWEQWQRKQNRP